MLAATQSIWANQWVADIVTGLVVAVLLAILGLLWRALKRENKKQITEIVTTLMAEIRPNGGASKTLGDVALRAETHAARAEMLSERTERKVDILSDRAAEQKGHTDTIEKEVFARLSKLETTTEAAARRADDAAHSASVTKVELHVPQAEHHPEHQ